MTPSWEAEVRALYERSLDMELEEFERLITQVILHPNRRPDHPGLPACLPFATETILE